MFYNAKNNSIRIGDADIDYISFGNGNRNLIMIPGVGDGLRTVKGAAVPFAVMYSKLAKKYKVYVFSRRKNLPENFSTKDMAEEIYMIMNKLNIESACVVGVSLGGMIAQYLAIDHPEKVEKLILVVTLSQPNDTVVSVIDNWLDMAKSGNYKKIMIDMAEKSYSDNYLKNTRWMYSFLGSFGKPKSFERFITMANACKEHNAYNELASIKCPTLVIGGKDDKIVTGEASEEISARISGSRLIMYDGLGHGLYEEAKDFLDNIISF